MTAEEIIHHLSLQPLPVEGGYFRETYRSGHQHSEAHLPQGYPSPRSLGTAIYYLLTPDTFSALHRLRGDEIYHFYLGDPVDLLLLNEKEGRIITLGHDLHAGQVVQAVVPGYVWQGSRLQPGGQVALMGTTMAPGFDFADYEHGDRSTLTAQHPEFAEQIGRLTRQG